MLLLALLDTLVGLLLGAHRLHHVHQIASHHISLLLLGGQGPLSRLQSLLLVLLHASGLLRVLAHRTLVRVPEEHALLLRWHVRRLFKHFALLLDQNRIDGLVDSLRRLGLVVLILAVLEPEQVLPHAITQLALRLLDLLLLLLPRVSK